MMHNSFVSILYLLLFFLCSISVSAASEAAGPVVKVGAEVLLTKYRELVAGKRVGVITNHSAIIGQRHVIDLLHADADVTVVALFGPEHGLRGTADAGEAVFGWQ